MSSAVVVAVPGDAAVDPPSVLVELLVAAGQEVDRGQCLARIAVDKAEVELSAPVRARVGRTAESGAILAPGATLAVLEPIEQRAAAGATTGTAQRVSTGDGGEVSQVPVVADGDRVEPLSRLRRTIASTMMASLSSTAQLTSVISVDVTHLMQERARWNPRLQQRHGLKISPFHLLARAVCLTLPRHPMMNSWVDERAEQVTFHDYVDLGVAVDTPSGLIVVTVRDADQRDVAGLARSVADLAGRARAGELRPADVRRGTFTLSNTGSNGTTFGTPILTLPQVGLLATYAIERRAVLQTAPDGTESIAIRSMMNLALTYDHRVIDGADAGRFLQDLRWVIAHHNFASELSAACE